MTKRKIIVFSTVIGIVLTTLIITNYLNNDGVVIASGKSEESVNNKTFSLMLETSAGSGEYQVSTDTTWPGSGYEYNENLSSCENGSTLIWNEDTRSVTLKANISDKCYLYFDKKLTVADICNNNDNFVNCIKEYYNLTGDNYSDLYYHDGIGEYINSDQEAGDNSYRYSGANPNNYICFGTTGINCLDENNQYRIIGIFEDKIKIIKKTSYGTYSWDITSNTWSTSTLNNTLNSTYLNSFDNVWQEMITFNSWKIGCMNYSNGTGIPKSVYNYEVVANNNSIYDSKIGLMYVSDYGYAASPDYWQLSLRNYQTANENNWLYTYYDEWLISRATVDSSSVFFVNAAGVNTNLMTSSHNIRPTFYLNQNILYLNGTGTQNDPYIIGM